MTRSHLDTTTLGDIVARDARAGAILDRYGLDYCCGGARSLAEGCVQSGVDIQRVVADLEALDPEARETPEEDLPALIDHILAQHHAYIREAVPVVQNHLTKVVAAHGERHTELPLVASRFTAVAGELAVHMMKEERVLFPYIRALADAARNDAPPPPDMFGTIQNPIRMMEAEHEEAGGGLAEIRELTRGYEAPDDACTTYRMLLEELETFEHDLHRHVHLENNVLFPRAVDLEEEFDRRGGGLKCQRGDL
jgi:regulator of cell morphogenesis and NO signaling